MANPDWLIVDLRGDQTGTMTEPDDRLQDWIKEYLYDPQLTMWNILVHTERMLILEWLDQPNPGALYIEIRKDLLR